MPTSNPTSAKKSPTGFARSFAPVVAEIALIRAAILRLRAELGAGKQEGQARASEPDPAAPSTTH